MSNSSSIGSADTHVTFISTPRIAPQYLATWVTEGRRLFACSETAYRVWHLLPYHLRRALWLRFEAADPPAGSQDLTLRELRLRRTQRT